jgi:alpha-L-fucosidase
MEFYGFVHFTVNTFTGREWGYGDESPALFNPTAFDAGAIAGAAAAAGMKGLILTAKHHDGFCLWPSVYTAHSVRNAPWKEGRGDVVREMADACRTHGIGFGVYLSPWDRNHADYGRPDYVTYYRNQLRELLVGYGPVFMVWLDGANGGDGYYGGARETRTVDRSTYYGWPETIAMIRELCPGAMVFSDAGPDCRWVGNEDGMAGDPCWATLDLDRADRFPGGSTDGLNAGARGGNVWLPAECDVSIRPGWFHHASEDALVKSPGQLVDLFYRSVGRGACLNLNLPPDRTGRLHANDLASLAGFRRILDGTFTVDLAHEGRVSASHTRGPADGPFGAHRVVDGDPATYWTAPDEVRSAELVLEPGEPVRFNVISLREHLPLGQRIDAFAIDVRDRDGSWSEYATGTSIGARRLIRGPMVTAAAVRLRILEADACPALREFALHAEPLLLATPAITRDWAGTVSIHVPSAATPVRYTTDGGLPGPESPLCSGPFPFPRGGIIRARAFSPDGPDASDPAAAVFGACKARWRVVSANGRALTGQEPRRAIDQAPGTAWVTDSPLAPDGRPHELVIDFGEILELTGLTYLPHIDTMPSGAIDRYECWLSPDGTAWNQAPGSGEFGNLRANPVEQIVPFGEARPARYLRFVALHALDDTPPAVAELGVTLH